MKHLTVNVLGLVRRGLRSLDAGLGHAQARLLGVRAFPLFVVVASIALLSVGCGARSERRARTALDVAAHAVVAADDALAPRYREAHVAALDAATTASDYDARMTRWNRAEESIRAAGGTLLSVQTTLDATHARGGALGIAGCMALALRQMRGALSDVGVDPPPKVAAAIDGLTRIGATFCSTEVPR